QREACGRRTAADSGGSKRRGRRCKNGGYRSRCSFYRSPHTYFPFRCGFTKEKAGHTGRCPAISASAVPRASAIVRTSTISEEPGS
ncbi:hypothetical protein, partial [Desulfofundulus sp.]|uniref:hypothetical protein n=1 Tax=Desulfofundulus sp. TaxID=2282750 RepID=UPI003C776FEB